MAIALSWRLAGTEDTYRNVVKKLAFVGRYAHAGEWMFNVDGEFLQDFIEATVEIVEEENRKSP